MPRTLNTHAAPPQRTPIHRPDSVDAETLPPHETMAVWGDDEDAPDLHPWSPALHIALLTLVSLASVDVLAGIAGFVYYRWLL